MTVKKKFIVAKYSNSGIGDHLSCVLGAWWYAKNTGRILVIDWRGSRFNIDKTRNCFLDFFDLGDTGVTVIADDQVEEIEYSPPFYPSKWSTEKIRDIQHQSHTAEEIREVNALVSTCEDRSEPTVIFNQHIAPLPSKRELQPILDNLKFSPRITGIADKFTSQHFSDKKIIGIHIRHGNGENIGDRSAYWLDGLSLVKQLLMNKTNNIHEQKNFYNNKMISGYNRFLDNMPISILEKGGHISRSEKRLYDKIVRKVSEFQDSNHSSEVTAFICTDSQRVLKNLQIKIPHIVAYPKRMLSEGQGPLHQLTNNARQETAQTLKPIDAVITEDMFVEMSLLDRCDELICIPSQFSHLCRLRLADNKINILKPPLINRVLLKLI